MDRAAGGDEPCHDADTRSADVLKILRDNGTYDIAITRQDGVQLLTDQVISDGTFTIPTSTSHLMRIEKTRK